MDAIVAVYSDWGIGKNGTQPIALKADRRHFRELTEGSTVIVGRKTMEDFPSGKPLKGRNNVVISRQNIAIDGAVVVHDTAEALRAAGNARCFVIGGESVFRQFFPFTDRVFLTKLSLAPESDSFFPNLDSDPHWRCTSQEPWQEENGVSFCFCIYERLKSVAG